MRALIFSILLCKGVKSASIFKFCKQEQEPSFYLLRALLKDRELISGKLLFTENIRVTYTQVPLCQHIYSSLFQHITLSQHNTDAYKPFLLYGT